MEEYPLDKNFESGLPNSVSAQQPLQSAINNQANTQIADNLICVEKLSQAQFQSTAGQDRPPNAQGTRWFIK